ncbi:hypothetical protein [Salinicoccus halodurans]|uniref:Uncharacterized protein n=1 Tax=Salinicoccus halodurans TaxID=407035 RepID=A0A0F7HJP4_9STAP|nr:hypothetical protein [Salinicoccus halodurans]AKG72963.1 hypothetical protein AAT16_01220 [Salinicoccus halodurans]SFK76731.1 hypothetical protein SAMN05216235_1616 [Salinicoccus halodurans]
MRLIILVVLAALNIFSIIQLGQYNSGDLIALMSVRIILAVITFMLSLAYMLVRGTRSMVMMSIITALIALAHIGLIIYINL